MGRRAADVRGPRRSEAKERFWRRHVDRQAAGRLSVRAYCEQQGLAEPSFYAWRRELARRDEARRRSMPQAAAQADPAADRQRDLPSAAFVRLDVRAEPSGRDAAIEIVLPGEVRILVPPGVARGEVREVLAALGVVRDGEPSPC